MGWCGLPGCAGLGPEPVRAPARCPMAAARGGDGSGARQRTAGLLGDAASGRVSLRPGWRPGPSCAPGAYAGLAVRDVPPPLSRSHASILHLQVPAHPPVLLPARERPCRAPPGTADCGAEAPAPALPQDPRGPAQPNPPSDPPPRAEPADRGTEALRGAAGVRSGVGSEPGPAGAGGARAARAQAHLSRRARSPAALAWQRSPPACAGGARAARGLGARTKRLAVMSRCNFKDPSPLPNMQAGFEVVSGIATGYRSISSDG